MKTFEITVSMTAWKTITVQAESEDDINVWDIEGILDELEYSQPEIDAARRLRESGPSRISLGSSFRRGGSY